MDRERLTRADSLFVEALDLEPSAREPFLRSACGDDAELLLLVTELLRDAETGRGSLRPGQALEGPLWDEASAQLSGQSVAAGSSFGAWEIVRSLGAGGMAEVFLARRIVGGFEQVAALKLIRRGTDSDEVIQRFRQERQILASLDHPNIARLLDGGVSDDGRPFFVMERVDGKPIDQRCREEGASIELRLRRFLDVCGAVEHAHRKLVVHRDLKPSNILIDTTGQVKLLDFGIAKLLDPATGVDTRPMTRTVMRVMTPEYASPEQVRGEPATTAGDIYQLGLILYELLTGQRAQNLRDAHSLTEVERIVCEQVPTRPSSLKASEEVSPRNRRRLRGDLDNIVLKALRKEPDARYPSVAALHDDIVRHLEGRPVAARRPTVGYRVGRFVRRHAIGVAAGSLVVLSVLGGLAATYWQARIAAIERDNARREAATAKSVSEFLIGTFGVADPSEAKGRSVTAVELLDSGTKRMDALASEPDVQATMKDVIGRVYSSLGLYDPSRKLLTEALETRRSLSGAPNAQVAESLDHLGWVQREQGAFDDAEKNLSAGLAMRRAVFGNEHEQVAVSLRNLSQLAQVRDDLPRAQALLEEALAIRHKLYGERHQDIATVLKAIGLVKLQRSDAKGAAVDLEAALSMQRELHGPDHPDTADALNALGMAEQNLEHLDRAEGYYREALAIRLRVLGPRHAHTSISRNNLAGLLYQKRDFAAAAPIFRENLEQQRATLGPEHPTVATSMTNLGVLLTTLGDLDGAEPLLRDALRVRAASLGEHHRSAATTRYYLGRVLRDRGKAKDAEALMRQSMPDIPETDANLAGLYLDLGEILLAQARLAEARVLLEDSLRLHTKIAGADHWRTAAARSARGEWRERTGDKKGAEEDFRAAWAVLSKRPEDDIRRKAALARLTACLTRSGRGEEAATLR